MEGTLQATDSNAARLALTNAGYAVTAIHEQGSVASKPARPPAVQRPAVPVPRPSPTFAPRPLRPPEIASAVQVNAITGSGSKPSGIKTKPGKDKHLFFLFTQLGSYLRSGINPAQALNDLVNRTPALYHASMQHAAQVVSEGGRLSDAFEAYPYLYPPDVIGVMRAGETAGFLPEAMDEIAAKMGASHHLRRRLFYFLFMFVGIVVSTPFVLGVVEGSLKSIKLQDDAGGSLPVAKTLGSAVMGSFLKDLPISLVVFASLYGFWAWFNSMKMREFRHKVIMRTPVIGNRARAEAMARFTWAMTMISRGGLSPQNTFLLALQSVPNLAIRKDLEVQGQQMKESDKLSTALRKTNLLPFEYGSIVETGEITGDVPRALESVHKASDAEYQAQNATAVVRSSFGLYIIFGVLILIISAWLLVKYYDGLIKTILGS